MSRGNVIIRLVVSIFSAIIATAGQGMKFNEHDSETLARFFCTSGMLLLSFTLFSWGRTKLDLKKRDFEAATKINKYISWIFIAVGIVDWAAALTVFGALTHAQAETSMHILLTKAATGLIALVVGLAILTRRAWGRKVALVGSFVFTWTGRYGVDWLLPLCVWWFFKGPNWQQIYAVSAGTSSAPSGPEPPPSIPTESSERSAQPEEKATPIVAREKIPSSEYKPPLREKEDLDILSGDPAEADVQNDPTPEPTAPSLDALPDEFNLIDLGLGIVCKKGDIAQTLFELFEIRPSQDVVDRLYAGHQVPKARLLEDSVDHNPDEGIQNSPTEPSRKSSKQTEHKVVDNGRSRTILIATIVSIVALTGGLGYVAMKVHNLVEGQNRHGQELTRLNRVTNSLKQTLALRLDVHQQSGGSWPNGIEIDEYTWRFQSSLRPFDKEPIYVTGAYKITFRNRHLTTEAIIETDYADSSKYAKALDILESELHAITRSVKYSFRFLDAEGFHVETISPHDNSVIIGPSDTKEKSGNFKLRLNSLEAANRIEQMQILATFEEITKQSP